MEKIIIKVSPGAKKNEVKKISKNSYKIFTTSRPQEGRANKAAIDLLSRELGKSKSELKIIKGLKSKEKIVEIY